MLQARFPYEKFRAGQRESIRTLVEEYAKNNSILFSAPTGFGKTICILYALKNLDVEKAIYAVRTINEIQPPLREAVKLKYKPVFLISKKKMCPLAYESKSLPLEDFWENCKILREGRECVYYENTVRLKIRKWEHLSLGVRGPFRVVKGLVEEGLCPYYFLRELIEEADLIIVTYPYIFNPIIREYTFDRIDFEEVTVVVDEAHSLINLVDMVEKSITKKKIEHVIREVERYVEGSEMLVERLSELLKLLEKLPYRKGYTLVDKDLVREVLGDPQEWYDLAVEIRYKKLLEADVASRKVRVRVHTSSIATFSELLDMEEFYLFTNLRRGEKTLTLKLVDPSLIVSPPLTTVKGLILTSGTLPSKEYFKNVLGVNRDFKELDVEVEYGPIFPLENRVVVVLTYLTSRYDKREESTYKKYAEVVREAYKATPKITLAVYPSYEFMGKVLEKLKLGREVIVETEDTKISEVADEALERGKVLINAVAGGKLCEGVEIVDESGRSLIETVVIAGIPYPQPDDYSAAVLRRLSEKIGEVKAREHLVRDVAVVKVKQALGRAIRSEHDRAVYILADYRFMDERVRSKLRIPYNIISTTHNRYLEILSVLASEYF